MRFRWSVRLDRRVAEPHYGPQAYRLSSRCEDFPFGKGARYKTGREAYEAAMAYAREHLDECSAVSVWRLSVSGNGRGEYIKDTNTVFKTGWDS